MATIFTCPKTDATVHNTQRKDDKSQARTKSFGLVVCSRVDVSRHLPAWLTPQGESHSVECPAAIETPAGALK